MFSAQHQSRRLYHYLFILIVFFTLNALYLSESQEYTINYTLEDVACLAEGRVDRIHVTRFTDGQPIILRQGTLTHPDIKLINNDLFGYIKSFSDSLRERGIALVIVPVPPHPLVFAEYLDENDPLQKAYDAVAIRNAYTTFVTSMNALKVPTVDVLTPLENYPDSSQPLNLFSDSHWTPLGARISAQAIAEHIKEDVSEDYATLEKKAFISEYVGQSLREYPLLNRINETCQGDVHLSIPHYRTLARAQTMPNLLDTEVIEVAYMGTSYGSNKFNVVGFLQEELSVTILNNSVGGGSMFGAFEDFFLNEPELVSQLKMIIWEFPFLDIGPLAFESNGLDRFREFIATVDQTCHVVYEASVGITHRVVEQPTIVESAQSTENERWGDDNHQTEDQNSGYYGNALFTLALQEQVSRIVLHFEDHYVNDVDVVIHFGDGTEDSYSFHGLARVKNQGYFYLDVVQSTTINHIKLNILDKDIKGNIQLSACE